LQVLLDHNGIVPQYVKAHQKYTESGCNAEQADVEATNFVLPNEQTRYRRCIHRPKWSHGLEQGSSPEEGRN
jgi:hypothetical protein